LNTQKARLQGAYVEALADLAPEPEFLRLFRAVVMDAYQTRQADARQQVVETERRLAQIEKRKARLEEAYSSSRPSIATPTCSSAIASARSVRLRC
jgi:hypothetical protein